MRGLTPNDLAASDWVVPWAPAPCAQPLAPLFESQTPERVRRDLEIVRPMNGPTPLADARSPEQVVIVAQRRKDRKLVQVLGDIDNALCPPLQVMTRRRPSSTRT